MSTPFYDLASLVVVPSGYKASKVYAQKPLTTDGQLAFTRSTTATRVNSAGLIEASAVNVPRLDYLNSTCPKLLLEPQRSNSAQYSEQFNNAYWSKVNCSETTNSATSPDGGSNADKIIFDNGQSTSFLVDYAQPATVGTYTASIFAKAAGFTSMRISAFSVEDGETTVIYNLSTGVITSGANHGTITNYGNGWYRCTHTKTFTGLTGKQFQYCRTTVTGNGVDGFLVYGAQVEAGAYATSYIPTLGAAVTRGADATLKTGISSLIGTEFTLFYDGFETTGGNSSRYIVLKGAGSTYVNFISIEAIPGQALASNVNSASGASVFAATSSAITNGQRVKVALRCKNNSFAFYLNGSLVASQASGTVPVTSDLYLGYYTDYSDNYNLVNQAIIFPTGLTNAQLAELTTI